LQIFTSEYEPALKVYLAEQIRFVELQKEQTAKLQVEMEAKRATNTTGILVSLAVIVAAIFAGTTWLVRSIREPLNMANDLAARIAEGDLTHSVHSDRTDRIWSAAAFAGSDEHSLGRMVSEIRGGTDSIAIASAEIATGNDARRSVRTDLPGNLQATASSMDGITPDGASAALTAPARPVAWRPVPPASPSAVARW